MTDKLKWRLTKLPTPEEVRDLVKDKIISAEEAKEVLFTSETVEERDKKSLESEIKFLKEVIDSLANRDVITKTIIEHIPQYITQPFYQPYYYWASPSYTVTCASAGTTGGSMYLTGSTTAGAQNCAYTCTSADSGLSGLNTF